MIPNRMFLKPGPPSVRKTEGGPQMGCWQCASREKGRHSLYCPGRTPTGSYRWQTWERGYFDGRNRRKMQQETNPVYRLGWCQGASAADEAENVSWHDYYEIN